MMKKAVPAKAVPAPDNNPEESDYTEDEIPSELADFLSNHDFDSAVYTIRLYKLVTEDNKTRRKQCDEWENEIPRVREIGERFGGGPYEEILNTKNAKGERIWKSKRFDLDSSWDTVKAEADIYRRQALIKAQQEHQPQQQNNQFSTVKEVAGIFAPMFEILAKSIGSGSSANPTKLIESISEMGIRMAESNYNNAQNLIGQVVKSKLAAEVPAAQSFEDEDEQIDMPLVNRIFSFVEKYAPMIIPMKPEEKKQAFDTFVAPNPDYQKLIKSRAQIAVFHQMVSKRFKPEEVEGIFEMLQQSGHLQAVEEEEQPAQ
jgi:hypothetical protein